MYLISIIHRYLITELYCVFIKCIGTLFECMQNKDYYYICIWKYYYVILFDYYFKFVNNCTNYVY